MDRKGHPGIWGVSLRKSWIMVAHGTGASHCNVTAYVLCVFMIIGCCVPTLLDSCDKTRRVFTDSWGVITDGPLESNYTQDSHCEWLIKANGTNQYITLSFRSMGTECSYDYVFVYDGDSFKSPLLGSFSGKTAPQQVIASSGYVCILLFIFFIPVTSGGLERIVRTRSF